VSMDYETRREIEVARQRAMRKLTKRHWDEFLQLFAEAKVAALARRGESP